MKLSINQLKQQLKDEKAKNTKLQDEINQLKQQLKEQMNKIAML